MRGAPTPPVEPNDLPKGGSDLVDQIFPQTNSDGDTADEGKDPKEHREILVDAVPQRSQVNI